MTESAEKNFPAYSHLPWQILAEAASIAQGKEQQKQDTIKKP
ncbi:hypothetical protein ACW17M_24050 [Vreelandella sp. 2A-K22]